MSAFIFLYMFFLFFFAAFAVVIAWTLTSVLSCLKEADAFTLRYQTMFVVLPHSNTAQKVLLKSSHVFMSVRVSVRKQHCLQVRQSLTWIKINMKTFEECLCFHCSSL